MCLNCVSLSSAILQVTAVEQLDGRAAQMAVHSSDISLWCAGLRILQGIAGHPAELCSKKRQFEFVEFSIHNAFKLVYKLNMIFWSNSNVKLLYVITLFSSYRSIFLSIITLFACVKEMFRIISIRSTDGTFVPYCWMLLLGLSSDQCHLNETLGHTKLNYIRHRGARKFWVKWKFDFGSEKRVHTQFHLQVMIKDLNIVLLKKISYVIWSVLHYKIVGLTFCYTALKPGLSERWLDINKC